MPALVFDVEFERDAESGVFVVTVPALPEVCTEGATLGEARANAEEAILCALESRVIMGRELPDVVTAEGPGDPAVSERGFQARVAPQAAGLFAVA